MQELPESSDYLRENLILLMQMGFTDLYKNITNLKLAKNNFDDALSKVLGQWIFIDKSNTLIINSK